MPISQLFDSIIGQSLATSLLEQALASNHLAPAYLFAGDEGIGKATTAKAFAQLILDSERLDNHPDFLYVEPTYLQQEQLIPVSVAIREGLEFRQAPQIRINQIRQVNQFLCCSPLISNRQVVVVESAELMPPATANAFLKTLEEPGDKATIILTSNQSDRLLPTIGSRCQVVPFLPLGKEELKQVLGRIGDDGISEEIVAMAQGSPGKAIAISHHLQSIPFSLLNPRRGKLSEALSLAREVGSLPLETQLILADYWQIQGWQQQKTEFVSLLETAKSQLLKVSPQLLWEVALSQCEEGRRQEAEGRRVHFPSGI